MVKPFGEDWDYGEFPLAYLITFRTYGTWLHGDERTSVELHHGQNKYTSPKINPNAKLEAIMAGRMKHDAIILSKPMRRVVESAIKEVCKVREYRLFAINIRTNHGHVVVSAQTKPEPIADAFKSYSTRKLRAAGMLTDNVRPWARGRSRRYLWKEEHVERAISYVLYSQGDTEFQIDD